ncbi:hypothetical protein WJX84_007785 [Apatococcus fuscideae]|uniref:CREG-like beta-barrel domain-containing protein n=1 Tax=Apatococcus fuscideae TaxID=2026836 RepID=A0AAW1TE59_9CHLO
MLPKALIAAGTALQLLGLASAGFWESTTHLFRQAPVELPQPPIEARMIVHENEWGVLSTISHKVPGVPFGNVLSYSDGPRGKSWGRPFFYMRSDDPTAQDARANSNASLAVTEAQTGSCRQRHYDEEDPNCARLALAGRLLEVPAAELPSAHEALFSRHPQMIDWPPNHHFVAFELHIESIRMLDQYGPHIEISADDYYSATLHESP